MIGRAVVVLGGTIGSWMLAVYIGYAPSVLYSYSGQGSLTASADQQIAAGVMWIPASVPFLVVLVALGASWFEDDARSAAAELGMRSEARA
jgi:cytochrome c oxidase assembly factor CtaG